ncbi:MAG: hypothetical protein AB1757_21300 [Acidobacteriota bacterium]
MKLGRFEITFKRRRERVREFGIQSLGSVLLELEQFRGNSNANKYLSRASQAAETIRKYRGQAVLGNQLVKNIINTRSAFTVGRGLNFVGGEAEKEFVKKFFEVNRLGLGYLQHLARERCFEGQILLALLPSTDNIPRVRFLSWLDTSYDVNSDPFDYSNILSVDYQVGHREQKLRQEQFAFFKFDTRLNSYEGTPLLAGILNQIENLDVALGSWRSINDKFSKPTSYWKFDDSNTAEAFQAQLKEINWKWGDPLAGAGDGQVLQLGYGPYTSMLEEISCNAKIIAGHTGVPVHYFGFADLLNNRAVADDIKAMFINVSEIEQAEWSQGFTDLVGRAMAMFNQVTSGGLSMVGARVDIEVVSEEAYKRIIELWFPLYLDGAITLETFLSKVPSIDEKTEAAKVIAETKLRGGTPRALGRAKADDITRPANGESEVIQ